MAGSTYELVDKFVIQLWLLYFAQSLALLLLDLLAGLDDEGPQVFILLDLLRKVYLLQQVYHVEIIISTLNHPTHPPPLAKSTRSNKSQQKQKVSVVYM